FSNQYIQLQKCLIEQSEMEEEMKQLEYEKLQAMTNYCFTGRCLSTYIVDYFTNIPSNTRCETCSNCQKHGEKVDITEEAQMILSCVKRMNEKFGVSMTAKVLRGSKDRKLIQFNLHKLTNMNFYLLIPNKTLRKKFNF